MFVDSNSNHVYGTVSKQILNMYMSVWDPFHEIFIAIQIRWGNSIICHVHTFIAITLLESRWEQSEIFTKFELRWRHGDVIKCKHFPPY